MEIKFKVFGKPTALKRHRTFTRGNFTGQFDPSKGDKKDFLLLSMQNKPDIPFDEPLMLTLSFVFPRPKSHYRTGKHSGTMKETAPTFHTSTPDTDNLIKFVCDALNHIYWKDDSCISIITATKTYGDTPYTELTVNTMET